jgi:antirestriction protein ArdC
MTNKTDKNSKETRLRAQSQIDERTSTDTNPKRASVYEQITERIIGLLTQGTIPWRKPWQIQTGLPRNLVSKKPYRGINVFLLHAMGYESPYWLTYRQALELGGNVRKGEKSCPVVFWKQLAIENKETGEDETIPLLRFYHVFNIDQCEGLRDLSASAETPAPLPSKPAAIVENMPQPPAIRHGMRSAFYSPAEDVVGLPMRERFEHEQNYFSTLYHELVHSTGHASRLNRTTVTESAGFGSNPYCREELIAEMGASFLCGQAGIAERTIENSAAYIQRWLEQLRSDKKLLVQAAAQAQKAVDFILGTEHEEGDSHE